MPFHEDALLKEVLHVSGVVLERGAALLQLRSDVEDLFVILDW